MSLKRCRSPSLIISHAQLPTSCFLFKDKDEEEMRGISSHEGSEQNDILIEFYYHCNTPHGAPNYGTPCMKLGAISFACSYRSLLTHLPFCSLLDLHQDRLIVRNTDPFFLGKLHADLYFISAMILLQFLASVDHCDLQGRLKKGAESSDNACESDWDGEESDGSHDVSNLVVFIEGIAAQCLGDDNDLLLRDTHSTDDAISGTRYLLRNIITSTSLLPLATHRVHDEDNEVEGVNAWVSFIVLALSATLSSIPSIYNDTDPINVYICRLNTYIISQFEGIVKMCGCSLRADEAPGIDLLFQASETNVLHRSPSYSTRRIDYDSGELNRRSNDGPSCAPTLVVGLQALRGSSSSSRSLRTSALSDPIHSQSTSITTTTYPPCWWQAWSLLNMICYLRGVEGTEGLRSGPIDCLLRGLLANYFLPLLKIGLCVPHSNDSNCDHTKDDDHQPKEVFNEVRDILYQFQALLGELSEHDDTISSNVKDASSPLVQCTHHGTQASLAAVSSVALSEGVMRELKLLQNRQSCHMDCLNPSTSIMHEMSNRLSTSPLNNNNLSVSSVDAATRVSLKTEGAPITTGEDTETRIRSLKFVTCSIPQSYRLSGSSDGKRCEQQKPTSNEEQSCSSSTTKINSLSQKSFTSNKGHVLSGTSPLSCGRNKSPRNSASLASPLPHMRNANRSWMDSHSLYSLPGFLQEYACIPGVVDGGKWFVSDIFMPLMSYLLPRNANTASDNINIIIRRYVWDVLALLMCDSTIRRNTSHDGIKECNVEIDINVSQVHRIVKHLDRHVNILNSFPQRLPPIMVHPWHTSDMTTDVSNTNCLKTEESVNHGEPIGSLVGNTQITNEPSIILGYTSNTSSTIWSSSSSIISSDSFSTLVRHKVSKGSLTHKETKGNATTLIPTNVDPVALSTDASQSSGISTGDRGVWDMLLTPVITSTQEKYVPPQEQVQNLAGPISGFSIDIDRSHIASYTNIQSGRKGGVCRDHASSQHLHLGPLYTIQMCSGGESSVSPMSHIIKNNAGGPHASCFSMASINPTDNSAPYIHQYIQHSSKKSKHDSISGYPPSDARANVTASPSQAHGIVSSNSSVIRSLTTNASSASRPAVLSESSGAAVAALTSIQLLQYLSRAEHNITVSQQSTTPKESDDHLHCKALISLLQQRLSDCEQHISRLQDQVSINNTAHQELTQLVTQLSRWLHGVFGQPAL